MNSEIGPILPIFSSLSFIFFLPTFFFLVFLQNFLYKKVSCLSYLFFLSTSYLFIYSTLLEFPYEYVMSCLCLSTMSITIYYTTLSGFQIQFLVFKYNFGFQNHWRLKVSLFFFVNSQSEFNTITNDYIVMT